MKNRIKLPIALTLAIIGLFAGSAIASAQVVPMGFDNSIMVHGVGFVEAAPDTAIIQFNLEGKANNAKASLDASNKKVADVLSALSKAGVAETDMNVTSMYMYAEPYYGDSKGGYVGSTGTGYTASQSLTAVAKDDNGVSDVIEAVLNAGATRIDSVAMSTHEVSFAIEVTGKDAKGTLSAMATSLGKVQSALSKLGIAKKDITVTYYTFYPTYGDVGGTAKSFTTTRTFTLKVHNLDKLDSLIDISVNAGADSISNISYAVEKAKALQKKARAMAVADAKEKAAELADLGDLRLGRVRNIAATYTSSQPYPGMFDTIGTEDKLGSPGMLRVTVELDVTFGTSPK